jgi:transposase
VRRRCRPPVAPVPPEPTARPRKSKRQLETEIVPVPVPDADRRCTACGRIDLKPLGEGKRTTLYDYVAAHFRKRVFVRETLACACGRCIVTAPAPDRVGDKTQYAPSFVAHVVVSKCADNRAQYNLAKEYARAGVDITRGTINAIFHRAAVVLSPLVARLFARIAASELVLADETSLRMQTTERRAFMWTLIGGSLIGYRFSTDRSGATPVQVLGDTSGTLLCDAYTGYNKLLSSGRRQRAGCLAHARRKIFDAREDPSAREALDLLGAIYGVERDAKLQRVEGTERHAEMRRERSRPIFARLLCWARRQLAKHGPRSQVGRAARYILADVLLRVDHHPAASIDQLLPDAWTPAD